MLNPDNDYLANGKISVSRDSLRSVHVDAYYEGIVSDDYIDKEQQDDLNISFLDDLVLKTKNAYIDSRDNQDNLLLGYNPSLSLLTSCTCMVDVSWGRLPIYTREWDHQDEF